MLDVLIVGAGPVGLFLACDLRRRGVECRIVDQAPTRSEHSKALAIVPRTLEILEMAGLVEPFIRCGFAIRAVNVLEGKSPLGRLSFEDLASAYKFFLIVPQSTTEGILEERLRALGTQVDRNHQLLSFTQDDEGVKATVRTPSGQLETLTSQWIVGCDGAHSAVRHGLDLPFTGAQYEEGFILADVAMNTRSGGDEIYLSYGSGVFGLFPMGPQLFRIIASVEADNHNLPTSMELQELVDKHVPFESTIGAVGWASNFRIHRRIVPQMHMGRAFLAGDAAHVHSPAGGQGMNTGIGDAWNLAWKLALVVHAAAPRSVLLSYDAERLPVAKGVLRSTNLMTQAVVAGARNPLVRAARALALPYVLRRQKLKVRFIDTLAEIDVAYPRSPIVSGDGARAPAVRVREKQSGMAGPLAGLLGRGHVLLLWSKPKEATDPDLLAVGTAIKRAYGQFIEVYAVESAHPPAALVLIRPDGYVAFAGPRERAPDLRRLLEKVLV